MKIGVALGSGAARGWAHIGVLKALREIGIHPQVVVGCSSGSAVGLAYAVGQLDEYERWVKRLTWKEIVGLLDLSFGNGFFRGDGLIDFFKRLHDELLIEHLPMPFGAVATEMASGREVWLTQGSSLMAVRASCAFPGLFSPVKSAQGWLIDGGLVNPVPVSLCRALGADVVIGVNLNAELLKVGYFSEQWELPRSPDEPHADAGDSPPNFLARFLGLGHLGEGRGDDVPPALMDVLSSSINIMQDRITRSRMAGDPPEIMLVPRLGDFGMLEFHRAHEAVDEGYRTTMAAREALLRYVPKVPETDEDSQDAEA